MRIISSSCGWCHESNPTEVRYCHNCGHEAHQPRMHCACGRCLAQGAATLFPTDVADLLSRVNYTEEEVRQIMEQHGFVIGVDPAEEGKDG